MTNVERWYANERIKRKQKVTLDTEVSYKINDYAKKALGVLDLVQENEALAKEHINKGEFFEALKALTALRTSAQTAEDLISECHNMIQSNGEQE